MAQPRGQGRLLEKEMSELRVSKDKELGWQDTPGQEGLQGHGLGSQEAARVPVSPGEGEA